MIATRRVLIALAPREFLLEGCGPKGDSISKTDAADHPPGGTWKPPAIEAHPRSGS
jgi:hypothetical protein